MLHYGNKVIVNGTYDSNTFTDHTGIIVCISEKIGVCFIDTKRLSGLHDLSHRLKNNSGYFVNESMVTKSIHKKLIDFTQLDFTQNYQIETYDGFNSLIIIESRKNINTIIVRDEETGIYSTIDRRFIKSIREVHIEQIECENFHYYNIKLKGNMIRNVQYYNGKYYCLEDSDLIRNQDKISRIIEEIPIEKAQEIVNIAIKDRIEHCIGIEIANIRSKTQTLLSYKKSVVELKDCIKNLDGKIYIHTLNLNNINNTPLQFTKEYENFESIVELLNKIIIKTKPLKFIERNYPGIEIIIDKIADCITVNGYHPHTSSGGQMCFGNFAERVERLLNNKAWLEIIEIVNKWIPIYNKDGLWRYPGNYIMCNQCKKVWNINGLDYIHDEKQFCSSVCMENYIKENRKEIEHEDSDSSDSFA